MFFLKKSNIQSGIPIVIGLEEEKKIIFIPHQSLHDVNISKTVSDWSGIQAKTRLICTIMVLVSDE